MNQQSEIAKEEVVFGPHKHAVIWQDGNKWTGIIKTKTSWGKVINGVRHVYPSQNWAYSFEHGPFDTLEAAKTHFSCCWSKYFSIFRTHILS